MAPDDERFRRLFELHRRAVLGYALRRAGDPADAADVLAETFLVAWRRLDEVPHRAQDARPWLLAVARRVLANQRRGQQRRGRLSERLGAELAAQLAAGSDRIDEDELVARGLERLEPADREMLRLACWEGLRPAQIATALGEPAGTVRSRLHRARTRLRRELADLGYPDAPAVAQEERR